MSSNWDQPNETQWREYAQRYLAAGDPDLSPSTRQILETYSGIPSEQVLGHVADIRNKAFKIFPYPCIGQWRFLQLSIGLAPDYPQILKRVKDGEILLDIGCCFAQDIRKLVADGAPAQNLYATDLRPEFFDLGFDLFKDHDKMKAHFIATDFFSPGTAFDELKGRASIIHTASFLHLFDWDKQVEAAKLMVGLLSKESGSVILGRQAASKEAFIRQGGSDAWVHDETSFKKLWQIVGEATGTRFDVEANITERPIPTVNGDKDRDSEGQDGYRLPNYFMRFKVVLL